MDVKTLKEKFNLTDADVEKPLPKPTPWTKPFWDAAKQHKLVLKHCKDCGNVDHPPYLYCRKCQSDNMEWREASGKATLYSFAVNEVGVPFPFMPDLPYITALVDLKEGPRMISTVVECDFKDLKNGMDLEVVFDDISPEFALPKWRPVKK
jgi:uncharacterized protein